MRFAEFWWSITPVIVLVLLVFIRSRFQRVTVFEYERGLRYARGRFAGVLGPGAYWFRPAVTAIRTVDVRPTVVPIPGQEILTADGVAVKVSIAARYEVADPATAVNRVEDFRAALYSELQLALRAVVSAVPVEALLEGRGEIGRQLRALAEPKVAALGVTLLDAEVKDLTLPGELKKIFAQVVRARQEGLAALEKARGETAALRNLANAAQMIERNPYLMQLRVLQLLGQQSGNTVVLGVPQTAGPIPIRTPDRPELHPGESNGGVADE